MWGEESYYENLSKVQREEMEKREKERRDRTKVEFVSGTAPKRTCQGTSGQATGAGTTTSGSNPDEEKSRRKSKWDQAVPGAIAQVAGQNPSAIQLTAVATGTRTAIPAFGTLPKKAKQT